MSEHLVTELRSFPAAGVVRLNVSSEVFLTTVETLSRHCEYFRALCMPSAVQTLFLPDAQGGAFFIDRDAKLFRRLLAYLRSNIAPTGLPDNEKVLLREEAVFYGCAALAASLQPPSPSRLQYAVKAYGFEHYGIYAEI